MSKLVGILIVIVLLSQKEIWLNQVELYRFVYFIKVTLVYCTYCHIHTGLTVKKVYNLGIIYQINIYLNFHNMLNF